MSRELGEFQNVDTLNPNILSFQIRKWNEKYFKSIYLIKDAQIEVPQSFEHHIDLKHPCLLIFPNYLSKVS